MSLATPKKIQTLQRKLYLKAKRAFTNTGWVVVGSADTPPLTSMTGWGSSALPVCLGMRECLQEEPDPRAGCGKSARPVR